MCGHFSGLLFALRSSLLFGRRSARDTFARSREFCGGIGALTLSFRLFLFRVRVFSVASAALFLYGAAFLGLVVFLPLFLVNVAGVSATGAGAMSTSVLMPGPPR